MFKKFLSEHSVSEYNFNMDMFPIVGCREFWDNFPCDNCVERAEAELGYTWPIIKASDFMEFQRSGDRAGMESIHFDRRRHLSLFAVAEMVENKGRFIPIIVDGIFTTCEETFWGLSAHMPNHGYDTDLIPRPEQPYIDLFGAETAEHLAMIVHILREPLSQFCPMIIDRVEYELERRMIEPYLIRRDFRWMGYFKRCNNWNPWILSNLLTVFLVTDMKKEKRDRAVRKMMIEIQHYYDSIPDDGGCDEGVNYWSKAGAALFNFLYQLKYSTNGELDLFDNKKIRNIASYVKKAHIAGDIFVNVADAIATGKSGHMPTLHAFAIETNQPELASFSAAVWKDATGGREKIMNYEPNIRDMIFESRFIKDVNAQEVTYPLHEGVECLPIMELAVIRHGELSVCAKGGHNCESHNHNDVGCFAVYDGTKAILADLGRATYKRGTFSSKRYELVPWARSETHNLPLINGYGEVFGEEYRSDRFSVTDDSIEISFGRAYDPKAGVKSLERKISFEGEKIVIKDAFSMCDGQSPRVEEVLVTTLPVTVDNGNVIIDDTYRICCDGCSICTDELHFNDGLLEVAWKVKYATRIKLICENADNVIVTLEKIR